MIDLAFICVLYFASKEDFKSKTVSDKVHIAIILLGLLKFTPVSSMIGLILVGEPLFLTAILTNEGIGGGDVKLLGAIGFYFGVNKGLFVLITGLFFTIIYALVCKKTKSEKLALIPFFTIGSVVALLI
ncbi:MAG: A24 family peptidase [Clostridia bacterium]